MPYGEGSQYSIGRLCRRELISTLYIYTQPPPVKGPLQGGGGCVPTDHTCSGEAGWSHTHTANNPHRGRQVINTGGGGGGGVCVRGEEGSQVDPGSWT